MAWWVIVLLLVAAFGPVLWIMPSRRDRLLSRLRAGARNRNLLVELTQLPDLAAPPEARVSAGGVQREPVMACTAYRLSLPRSVRHAPCWRGLAHAASTTPIDGWLVEGDPVERDPVEGDPVADASYWAGAGSLIRVLPEQVLAVELGRNHVSLYWRENVRLEDAEPMLDRLAAALKDLAEWHWDAEQNALAAHSREDPDLD